MSIGLINSTTGIHAQFAAMPNYRLGKVEIFVCVSDLSL